MTPLSLSLLVIHSALAGVYDPLLVPFTATPDELRAAAETVAALPWEPPEAPRKAKADAAGPRKEKPRTTDDKPPVVEVVQTVTVRFDDAGLTTTTRHDVWRIERDDTALRTDTTYWDPWREGRPEVDLRVVGADGKERRLDPSTLVEQSAATGGGEMYVDTRKLIAPLPGARRGAVVEQVETVRQVRPFLEGGQSGHIPVSISRVGRVEVVLDAPIGLPLHWDARAVGPAKETRKAGRRQVRWVVESPELLRVPPDLAPRDAYLLRYVAWSTAPDWGSVARAYATIVDELAVLPPEAVEAAKAARAREADDRRAATAMALWINERARYVAVELGAAAVVPRTPREVLARGYGDCKDKATFLVAMLRAVGIAADVALLRAGWGPDVDPDLPGPNLFNHAITVFGAGPERTWVDPTHPELPAGLLPDSDADHLALVASPATTSLVRTPAARPVHLRIDKRIVAHDYGRVDLVQELQFRPESAAELREQARADGVQALVDASTDALLGDDRARSVEVEYDLDLADLDRDVREMVRVGGSADHFVSPGNLTLKVGPGFSMNALPTTWQLGLYSDEHVRTFPIEMRAIVQDASLQVEAPRGYTAEELPAPVSVTWPGGGFTWRWTRTAEGAVRSESHIEVPRHVALADVETFVAQAAAARKASEAQLRFLNDARRAEEAGQTSRALHLWRAAAGAPDALVADRVGHAEALLAAGYAERAAAALAALGVSSPDTEHLPVTLGWDAASQAPFGYGLARQFAPTPLVERTRTLLQAKEAAGDDDGAHFYRGLLARMTLYDPDGVYGRGDVEAALALQEGGTHALRSPLGHLLRVGDAARVRELTAGSRDDAMVRYRVAAAVVAEGLEAGKKEANAAAREGAHERLLLGQAIEVAAAARQWDAARLLASVVPDSEEARSLGADTRRWTEYDLDEDTAVAAFRRFLRAQGDPAFAADLRGKAITTTLDPETVYPWSEAGRTSVDYLLDRAMSPRSLLVDGDAAGGYRVRVEPMWTAAKFRYYVVREKGALRVRAQGGQWGELGEEAGARLDGGRLADAQRWLDWALFDTERPAPAEWAGLWTADGDRSADRARLVVAVLTAGDGGGKRIMPCGQ